MNVTPRERSLILSDSTVRAILREENPKTQFRRTLKPMPFTREDGTFSFIDVDHTWRKCGKDEVAKYYDHACPLGRVGDRLWVRETWRSPGQDIVAYRADGECGAWMGDGGGGRIWNHHGYIVGCGDENRQGRWWGPEKYGEKWRPSVHMKRWASRLTLEIVDIKIEQLRDISEEDARAEGVFLGSGWNADGSVYGINRTGPFSLAWAYAYRKVTGQTWTDNPWVFVVSFRIFENAGRLS